MTREELIEGLKLLEDNMVYFDELLNDKGKRIDVHELLFESIEALEQEPCEDCISRSQALSDYADWFGYGYADNTFYKHLKIMPSIQPKPKTGHWRHYEGMLICSECGTEFYDDIMEYCGDDVPKCCPDCGANMESEE